MQPARIKPHAKEHTNNPGQRPNFRGHAAGDVEVTRACGKAPRPSKDDSKESLDDACHPPQARRTTGLTPSQYYRSPGPVGSTTPVRIKSAEQHKWGSRE
jgi:hypothetical protein